MQSNQPLSNQEIPIHQHLYEVYPALPKYKNDPEQSVLIKTYDLLLKRYEGIYGQQPKYFARSPGTATILGVQQYKSSAYQPKQHKIQNSMIGFPNGYISFCLDQNFIVAIGQCKSGKIRINNYQHAVHGEKILELSPQQWKYEENADDYSNLLVIAFKTIAILYNVNEMPALDLLIYNDFVQDQYLHWKEALCLAIYAPLHSILRPGIPLKKDMCISYLRKVSGLRSDISVSDLSLEAKYGQLCHHSTKYINFPEQLSIIIANSMTPIPKMMIQGKRHNLRACQIAIGIQIIKNELGCISQINSLKQLSDNIGAKNLQEFRETIDQYLPKESLTIQKIEQLTEKSMIDILKGIPFANNVIDENPMFKPYERIIFYMKELQLIEQLSSLDQNDPKYPNQLCDILNKSHENAIDSLQIGSEQLTQMINLIKDLTKCWKFVGNGWGGNLMMITEKKNADKVYDILVNQFYMSEENKILLSDDVQQYIKVVGRPGTGLSVLDPESQIWF